jgi:hypothetical protein
VLKACIQAQASLRLSLMQVSIKLTKLALLAISQSWYARLLGLCRIAPV